MIMGDFPQELAPKLYGAVTTGERGQVVIPAEARRDLDITPTTKLLVFGDQSRRALILTKAESLTEFLANAMIVLSRYEQMLQADFREIPEETH